MSYEITGTVKLVKDAQTFASGFTKREFVLTTEDERFPQDILIACIKEGCAMLDTVQAGDRLKVAFNIRGREWQDKHFVNLEAYRIDNLDGGAPADAPPVADEPFDDDFIAPF